MAENRRQLSRSVRGTSEPNFPRRTGTPRAPETDVAAAHPESRPHSQPVVASTSGNASSTSTAFEYQQLVGPTPRFRGLHSYGLSDDQTDYMLTQTTSLEPTRHLTNRSASSSELETALQPPESALRRYSSLHSIPVHPRPMNPLHTQVTPQFAHSSSSGSLAAFSSLSLSTTSTTPVSNPSVPPLANQPTLARQFGVGQGPATSQSSSSLAHALSYRQFERDDNHSAAGAHSGFATSSISIGVDEARHHSDNEIPVGSEPTGMAEAEVPSFARDQSSSRSRSPDSQRPVRAGKLEKKAKKAAAFGLSKRHECDVCQKVFGRPSQLATHKTSHTGDQPFLCPVAGCDRRFNVKSNMKRHLQAVHQMKLSDIVTEEPSYTVQFEEPMVASSSQSPSMPPQSVIWTDVSTEIMQRQEHETRSSQSRRGSSSPSRARDRRGSVREGHKGK